MSATQYDAIADAYASSEQFAMREHIETPVLTRALGPVTGLDVLDLACGPGNYTRAYKRAGARRVVGVDISPEMLRIALAEEAARPLGIEYQQHAAEALPSFAPFDAASAVYLLHYAESREQLLRMCAGVHRNLKPGGRFAAMVTLLDEPFLRTGKNYNSYGVHEHATLPLVEGSKVAIDFLMDDPPFTIQIFHWTRATYEAALREAGFRDIQFFPQAPSEVAIQRFGAAFWQDFIAHPPAQAISCTA